MPSERNLQEHWCARGPSLSEALASLPAEAHQARIREFAGEREGEARAAALLQLFTGDVPHMEDKGGLQGAVDLTLNAAAGALSIVEVTSTLDHSFQRNSARLDGLVDRVNRSYQGQKSWSLGFQFGWTMPPNRQLQRFAEELVRGLSEADAQTAEGVELGAIEVADKVVAYQAVSTVTSGVALSSWSTNTPNSADDPYLDRLSHYLAASDLIKRKVSKLESERLRLGSDRQHLYLLMAAVGDAGGLLPATPSVMTWGQFDIAEPVTDVWLDPGFGMLYHWNRTTGWVYHDLEV